MRENLAMTTSSPATPSELTHEQRVAAGLRVIRARRWSYAETLRMLNLAAMDDPRAMRAASSILEHLLESTSSSR